MSAEEEYEEGYEEEEVDDEAAAAVDEAVETGFDGQEEEEWREGPSEAEIEEKEGAFAKALKKRGELERSLNNQLRGVLLTSADAVEEDLRDLPEKLTQFIAELRESLESSMSELRDAHETNLSALKTKAAEHAAQLEADRARVEEECAQPTESGDFEPLKEEIRAAEARCEGLERDLAERASEAEALEESEKARESEIERVVRASKKSRNASIVRTYQGHLASHYLNQRHSSVKKSLKDAQNSLSETQAFVKKLTEKAERTQQLYKDERKLRRKLLDELMNHRGNMRVYSIATTMEKEEGEETPEVLTKYPDDGVVVVPRGGETVPFEFDISYPPGASISDVFEGLEPLTLNVLQGYQVSIMSFGVADTLKHQYLEGTTEAPGIIDLIMQSYILHAKEYPNIKYQFTVSFLEVYAGHIIDLLALPKGVVLEDVENPDSEEWNVNPVMQNRQWKPVKKMDDFYALWKKYRSRRMKCSKNPAHLIESHVIVTINMESEDMNAFESLRGSLTFVCFADSGYTMGKKLKSPPPASLTPTQFACWENRGVYDQIQFLRNPKGTFHCDYSLLTTLLVHSFDGSSKVLSLVHYLPDKEHLAKAETLLSFGVECRSCHLGTPTRSLITRKSVLRTSMTGRSSQTGRSSLTGRSSMDRSAA